MIKTILLIWILFGLAAFLIDGLNNIIILKGFDGSNKTTINKIKGIAEESMKSVSITLYMLIRCIIGGPFAFLFNIASWVVLVMDMLELFIIKHKNNRRY